MRTIACVTALVLAVAGCESAPRPTAAEGTVGMDTLRAESARCQELGLTPGSAEMVECIRAGQAPAPG